MNIMIVSALAFAVAVVMTTAQELDCAPSLVQGESNQPPANGERPTSSLAGKVATRALDFTVSRFAPPPEEVQVIGTPPQPTWTLVAQQNGWSDSAMSAVLQAAKRHHRDDVDMGALAYSVAELESDGNQKCRYPKKGGKASAVCIGMFQFKPYYWADDFKREGLNINTAEGQCEMFLRIVDEGLTKGVTAAQAEGRVPDINALLREILQPWAVRTRALKIYKSLTE